MQGKIVHQIAGQLLDIQHIVLDRACKGKTLANLGVVELRPQDTGGVQQLQCGVHRHPLLGAGHTGTILGSGGLALGHLVDKRGFPHVGDAQHHHADGTAHLSLFGVGRQLLLQQLPDGGGKFFRARAALGVGLQHRKALRPEGRCPFLRLGGIRLIHPVQHDHPGLPRRQLVHIRVAAGLGDAGVHDLTDCVHVADLGGDHPFCFCHVAGKPAQSFDLHGAHLLRQLLYLSCTQPDIRLSDFAVHSAFHSSIPYFSPCCKREKDGKKRPRMWALFRSR